MMNETSEIVRRGVVAVIPRAERLLVIRRSRHVIAPRRFCFPGGGIEPGETHETALVREMREELGVDVQPVRLLWESVTKWRVSLAWWLADLEPCARLVPNPEEVESIHWHTPSEMLALEELLDGNQEFLERLATGQIRLK